MNGRKGAALVAVLGSAAVGAVIVAAPATVSAVERVAFATNAERVRRLEGLADADAQLAGAATAGASFRPRR